MWIKSYIFAIAVTVVFSAFAETLMPETEMKKHISLVIGIIILIVIARPVLSIPVFDAKIIDLSESVSTTSAEISEKLSDAQRKEIEIGFNQKLNNTIEKDIYNNFSVNCRVNIVSKDENIDYVYIEATENDDIRKLVEETYGLKCVFEKGD